jgi:uncharacterized protein (TIGR00730 family)
MPVHRRLRDIVHTICVFCGSNSGRRAIYAEQARALARAIVARGMRIVYGAGSIGLMGALAEAALEAGGTVIGVAPRALLEREVVHRGLTELHVVETMLERKALMAEMSDAFVGLPGGLGTLDELFEMLTWNQLGFQAKPCGLLEVDGYYAQLRAFLDHAVGERFLRAEHRALLVVERDPGRLLDRLARARPPAVTKGLDRLRSRSRRDRNGVKTR